MTCGIYRITHRATGRHYVGLSFDIKQRWRGHRHGAANTYFSRALEKYGLDAFEFVILEICPRDRDVLSAAEIRWIKELRSMQPGGFNVTSGGEFPVERSEESRKAWAIQAREIWASPERRANQRDKRLGQKMSETAKACISATMKGVPKSAATRARMREAQRKTVADGTHAQIGRPISDATKAKISAAKKGQGKSAETRERMSAAQRASWIIRKQLTTD